MIALHPQFIVDENQEKQSVVLPFSEWVEVLHEIEDLEEIKAYDKAKADLSDETVSFSEAIESLASGEGK